MESEDQWPASDDALADDAQKLIDSENRAVARAEEQEAQRVADSPEAEDG